MNIAIYLDYFLPVSETFIFDQIEILSEHHNITVICKELDSSRKTAILNNVYNILPKRYSYRIYKYFFRRQWYKLSSIWISLFLAKSIRSNHFDLVICHFLTNALDFKYIKLKCPLMVFVHGYDGSQFLKSTKNQKAVNKIIGKDKQEFYFVSNSLKKIAQSHCPRLSGETIFLGTKLWKNKFTFKHHPTNIYICQISRLVSKKGIDISIKAIKILIDQYKPSIDIKFTIVGSGPLIEELKYLAEPYLNKNIYFIGEVEHKVALEILESSQIYIQPSKIAEDGDSDGLSISLLEAIAMDRWVITTPNSGAEELLQNNDKPENIYISEPIPANIAQYLYENRAKFINRPTRTLDKNKLSNYKQIQVIESYIKRKNI